MTNLRLQLSGIFLYILLISGLLMPGQSQAQYSETISTDRPGQAIGTTGVGKKVVQVQTGVNTNFVSLDEAVDSRTILSNTVVRFGILEWLEVNGTFNWQADRTEIAGVSSKQSGISYTELGTRMNFLANEGAIPAVGLQASLLLKAQSPEYSRDKLGSRLMLSTGNSLTEWLSLNTNLGLVWDGNGGGATSQYVLNFGISITDRIGAVAEMYGSFNEFDANFDAGLSYLVSNNFLFDITGGWQGEAGVSDWFIDAGLSFRFDWRD